MSDSIFEEEIVTLARLITKSPPLKKRERDEEGRPETSEEYPGAFNKEDLEAGEIRTGRTVRDIEKLGRNRQREIVKVFKRMNGSGCNFSLSRSGSLRSVWFNKFVDGREIRRSIPAPKGMEKLMRRAGIPEGECL